MNVIEKKISLGDGREIILETGKLAKQADGAVVVRMGGTMLLATVVSAKEGKEDADFMPLSVEYKEKFSASGKFPGGFLKREGRPGDSEILVCRLVDRALRPLFPEDYHADTFVTISLLSAESDIMPDALAGLAASAALSASDVPFHGPMSEVRVARVDGEFIINPTFTQVKKADLDIMVAATMDNIMMVEGEMAEVSEADMLEAMKFAHEEIKKHCIAQTELAKEAGKEQKREYCHESNDEELKKMMWKDLYDKVYQVAITPSAKEERTEAFAKVKEEYLESMSEEEQDEKEFLVSRYYHDIEKEAMRNMVLNERVRLDGRKTDEIRQVTCEIDYLPCTHGSSLFTRGETQSLTSVTLGTKMDEKIIDEVLLKGTEKFTLHYNFPPFSTNDARPNRGTGRREIGHGNLAFRALKGMVPADDENPYAIRVVSDILESNGSSSMATVCAGSLALMDAGVKLKKPVSGIAMGLITDETANKGDFKKGKYAVLSDILGDEDHLGDMDFKVTGTADGITACQMDIKVEGLDYAVLAEALEQARKGRLHILGIMNETIAEPREEMKPHAPRIVSLQIPKDSIGAIIGPGGKVIQEIQAKSGATIALNEKEDVAFAEIFASDQESIEMALSRIKQIIAVPEVGEVYKGIVKGIVPYGAFVEILPNKQGLLHISEIEWRHLKDVNEVLKMGQEVEVKLMDVEKGSGHLKLSRKVLLPKPE
jgi:polyribonucleotide nucleotidyltransferase